MNPSNTVRAALRQQLRGDLMMGVSAVPMQPPPPPGAAATVAKKKRLALLDEGEVRGCTKCALCKMRTQTVFGQGSPNARLVFVGEAPGYFEDQQGTAFVGRSGHLLTKMIVAMGTSREDVFICNVLKCRPPENRDPNADEILSCSPYLRRQLSIIEPDVLVALGAPAARTLLGTTESIGRLRGRFHDYYVGDAADPGEPIPLMPTYHPSYLLRSPSEKAKTWSDLQMVMDLLGLQSPARR